MNRIGRLSAALGAAALAAVSLVACSSGSTSTSGAKPNAGANTGQLVVWDLLTGSDKNWKATMDQADAAFEAAHPGVTVKRVAQPADPTEIHTLLQAAATAHSGPDLVMIWPWGDVLTYKASLVPIDQWLTPDTKSNLSGWEGMTFGGKTYGVPIGLQGNAIAFNKALFTKAGLDPSHPPTTLTGLLSACSALNKAGITPFAGGNKEGYLTGWMYSTLFPGVASEAQYDKLTTDDSPLTASPSKDAVDAMFKLVDDKCFSSSMTSTPFSPDGFQPFLDQKAAMTFSIYSQVQSFGTSPGWTPANVGVIPSVAVSRTPTYLAAGPMNVWAVTSFSKHQQLAAELAQFTQQATYQQQILDKDGYFSNNKQVSYTQYLATAPAASAVVNLLKSGFPTKMSAHQMQDAKTNDLFQSQLELAMLGQTSVGAALQTTEASRVAQRPHLIGS